MIHIQERTTKKVPGITSLFVTFDFKRVIVDELKLLNSCFYDEKTKEWEIPITCLSEFIDRVTIYDDITIDLISHSDTKHKQYNLGPYKTLPFPHQLEAINYGLNKDSWLLLDFPGAGKTIMMTYLAQELQKRDGIEHCLVIC